MTTRDLREGDRVRVSRKGQSFVARYVKQLGQREHEVDPIDPPWVTWRRVGSHQIQERVSG
jgi:hypothetical protein